MKRKLLILIPILTFSALILVLIIMELRSPPTWQTTINKYIARLSSFTDEAVTVESVIQASKPWNFSSQMRSVTYGDSVIFQTIRFSQKPEEYFTAISITPGDPPQDQRKLLPFPPKELWCAKLKIGNSNTVVFLALHEDLYNADMFIHEAPNEMDQRSLQEIMTEIGCD